MQTESTARARAHERLPVTRRASRKAAIQAEDMTASSDTTLGVLGADECEHLVALCLHQLLRARLQVEAEQRLGVRGADVQMPVGGLDREPVEVRDPALRTEALLELLELERNV